MTDFGGKTSIFSHPVYLFLREFSLQDFRGGSVSKIAITVVIDGEDTISSGCTLTDKMAIEKVQLTYLDLVVARW
ncbi:hypothetical protein D8Z68_18600 [Escherichia coli]|nr:hypothetical protein D8Z68_18600 [Escherichia coli]